MKTIFKVLLGISLLSPYITKAQDTIFCKLYPPIIGEVLQVNSNRILVHIPGTAEDDVYTIKKKQVTSIHYQGDSVPTFINNLNDIPGLKKVSNNWAETTLGIELFAPFFGINYAQSIYKDYLSISLNLSTNINHSLYQNANMNNWNWWGNPSEVRLDVNQNFALYNSANYYAITATRFNTINSKFSLCLNSYLLKPSKRVRPYVNIGLGLTNNHYRQANARYHYSHTDGSGYVQDVYSYTRYFTEGSSQGYSTEFSLGAAWAISEIITVKAGLSLYRTTFKAPREIIDGYDKTDRFSSIGGEITRYQGRHFFLPVSVLLRL